MNRLAIAAVLICCPLSFAAGGDVPSLIADRAAIERVYHAHRTGAKPPFEQVMPPELLGKLTREDLHKEAVLRKAYGVEITPGMLEAEVKRIDTTTRAPEMLAEIKAALGGDARRFAASFARPLLVERLLREKFDNDDALHAGRRRETEEARNRLLDAKKAGADPGKLLELLKAGHPKEVTEVTWQLGDRPEEKPGAPGEEEAEIRKRFGPDAQILSRPGGGEGGERKHYFSDMPGELQNVLRAQLRQAGDVSAVIEMPAGFLLFVATDKKAETLAAASLSLPKRSYEEWLAGQPAAARD